MSQNTQKNHSAEEVESFSKWGILIKRFTGLSKSFYLMLAFFLLIAVVGIGAGFHAMYIGYSHAYNITREIPWGILISTYVFFVVISTGLFIVSSLGYVFGLKDFMSIAKRAVFLSIVTVLAGFTVIFFEVENPFRMAIYSLISPNLTSNLWWMGTLYGAYLFFIITAFILLLTQKHKLAKYAGFFGVIAAVVANTNLGAEFGMLHAREFWYGAYLPIYFIPSAIMSGCATILFFTYLAHKVNNEPMDNAGTKALGVTTKLGILSICIVMFFTAWKIITGFVGTEGKIEAFKAMLIGKYALNFWLFEISIGMAIPLILYILFRGKNMEMIFVGSAFIILGIFFMRYDLVVLGQIVPVYYELGVSEYETLLTYFPSAHEILIVLGGIGIVATAFLLGEKVFNAHKVEVHENIANSSDLIDLTKTETIK